MIPSNKLPLSLVTATSLSRKPFNYSLFWHIFYPFTERKCLLRMKSYVRQLNAFREMNGPQLVGQLAKLLRGEEWQPQLTLSSGRGSRKLKKIIVASLLGMHSLVVVQYRRAKIFLSRPTWKPFSHNIYYNTAIASPWFSMPFCVSS